MGWGGQIVETRVGRQEEYVCVIDGRVEVRSRLFCLFHLSGFSWRDVQYWFVVRY